MKSIEPTVKISKEIRRAKRKKTWLLDGNIIPLSTTEKKSIRNREYKERCKRNEKEENVEFNPEYKNILNGYVDSQSYNVKGGLTYKNNVGVFKCFKDAMYIFEELYVRGLIYNYFFIIDYEPNHAHTHYVLNAVNPGQLDKVIYKLFNKFKRGNSYYKIIKSIDELTAAKGYCIAKINVNNRKEQFKIDYWSIRTAKV